MVRKFKLIRRSALDLRKFINSNWKSIYSDFQISEHYPVILNRYYKQADENLYLEDGDKREVRRQSPNYRLYYGQKHWEYLSRPPRQGASESEIQRYKAEPLIKRQLSKSILELGELCWHEIAEEVYESFLKNNRRKRPKGGLFLEHMLVIQPSKQFFLVRNPEDNGEFIVLDLHNDEDSQDDFYETDTNFSYDVGQLSFARHQATNWPKHFDRNVLGLLKVPQSSPAAIEARIREDLDWKFNSNYSDKIHFLLQFAISKMEPFGENIAIAESPSRFNDAMGDENWMAVRIDDYGWDNGGYFGYHKAKTLNMMPDDARILLGIISQLLAVGIRQKFTESFGFELIPMCVWCLAKQRGKWVFAFADSNGNDGAAYIVDPKTGSMTFIGLCLRFDWNFASVTSEYPAKEILEIISVDDWIENLKSGAFKWDQGDPDIIYKDLIPENNS